MLFQLPSTHDLNMSDPAMNVNTYKSIRVTSRLLLSKLFTQFNHNPMAVFDWSSTRNTRENVRKGLFFSSLEWGQFVFSIFILMVFIF